MIQYITSFSNEKIKFISSLKEKKNRDKSKRFFIEGYREIKRAIESNKINLLQLFISRECFLGSQEDTLIKIFLEDNKNVFELPKKIFEKISYRDRPDGLIAIGELPDFSFGENSTLGNFVVIIEGVEKPGNLGTILRTAEGAGVDCVIVADPRIDLFNPNVIRSSTGTIFTIPVKIGNIVQIIDIIKKRGLKTISVTPESNNFYFDENFNKPIALIFGSEQYGLSSTAKYNSDSSISIPMKGRADSLNLAMSAGIIMYDVVRQRLLK